MILVLSQARLVEVSPDDDASAQAQAAREAAAAQAAATADGLSGLGLPGLHTPQSRRVPLHLYNALLKPAGGCQRHGVPGGLVEDVTSALYMSLYLAFDFN